MEYEQFIKLYQESQSIFEVCDKTGMDYNRVTSLASKLRKVGIPLKYMRRNLMKPEKIEQLKKIAGKIGS